MYKDLSASSWKETMEKIRICHLSLIGTTKADIEDWRQAFEGLVKSVKEERVNYPEFAEELSQLTEATGSIYDFNDIFEEYFDHLEEKSAWQDVIASCDELVSLFKWNTKQPSEYMFRKGNALEKSGDLKGAKAFGQEWLSKYPTDLYAVASNVFILIELKEYEEADKLTKKYLTDDLICNKTNDTFFMAAYRLCEITKDINAKQRIETKIAEYEKMTSNQ